MAPRVLIAGVSTRGLAESAARAGYDVVAVDGFGDLDLRACCREVAVARAHAGRFTIERAVAEAHRVACDAVVYVASFENHPAAVTALARGRALWGNAPTALAEVRDPFRFCGALFGFGIAATWKGPPSAEPQAFRWLRKPAASGGGAGIRTYRAGEPVPPGTYLQEQIVGAPGSVMFAADGHRAVPFGVTRMLVGDPAFGASGFRYCGSILLPAGDRVPNESCDAVRDAHRLAATVTERFGLVGVNGVDFVSNRGKRWYPLEANPRYTAPMELAERAYGLSIFETHVRACAGSLPAFDLAAAQHGASAVGKAIVYARTTVRISGSERWLDDRDIRDIPAPGDVIRRRQPICTVFARGRDERDCYRGLVQRTEWIYRAVEPSRAGAA